MSAWIGSLKAFSESYAVMFGTETARFIAGASSSCWPTGRVIQSFSAGSLEDSEELFFRRESWSCGPIPPVQRLAAQLHKYEMKMEATYF